MGGPWLTSSVPMTSQGPAPPSAGSLHDASRSARTRAATGSQALSSSVARNVVTRTPLYSALVRRSLLSASAHSALVFMRLCACARSSAPAQARQPGRALCCRVGALGRGTCCAQGDLPSG